MTSIHTPTSITSVPTRLAIASLAAATFLVAPATQAAGSQGELDATFSRDGVRLIDMGHRDSAMAVFLDAAGKVIITGESSYRGSFRNAMARLTDTGRFDETFGSRGKRVIDLFEGYDQPLAWDRAAGGEIIAFGALGASRYYLARFESDGQLDKTFGSDGFVTGSLPEDTYRGDVLVLASRKIVFLAVRAGGETIVRARQWNGSVDHSFGEAGKVVLRDEMPNLSSDGERFLLSGIGGPHNLVIRAFRSDGQSDWRFGDRGRTSLEISGHSADMVAAPVIAVLPTGGVIVATEMSNDNDFTSDLVVARLKPSGAVDQDYGTRRFDIGYTDTPADVVVLENGRVAIAGWMSPGVLDGARVEAGMFLLALQPDGSRWRRFGNEGVVKRDFGGTILFDAVLSPRGIVVVGTADGDFFAARFTI